MERILVARQVERILHRHLQMSLSVGRWRLQWILYLQNIKKTYLLVQQKHLNSILLSTTNIFSFRIRSFIIRLRHWVHSIALPLNYLYSSSACPRNIIQAKMFCIKSDFSNKSYFNIFFYFFATSGQNLNRTQHLLLNRLECILRIIITRTRIPQSNESFLLGYKLLSGFFNVILDHGLSICPCTKVFFFFYIKSFIIYLQFILKLSTTSKFEE